MKKNLFYKNKVYVTRKQQVFENSVLKKSISFNFLINFRKRNNLGFLVIKFFNPLMRTSNLRSQCYLTWRSGSFYSFFRLTRLTLRENFSMGFIKGVRKSSW